MSRTNIKVQRDTKAALDDVKQDRETWDECLLRLAQLEKATRIQTGQESTEDE